MLTDDHKAILDLEAQRFGFPGAKEEAVRVELRMSYPRYWQVLNSLIDRADAIEYAPLLCRRLQRRRDARVTARVAR